MKKYLLALVAICITAGVAHSQTVVQYGNDVGGNRISRSLTSLRLGVSDPEDSKPVENIVGKTKLTLYPNPTKGELTLLFEGLKDTDTTSLVLYNLEGKIISGKKQLKPSDLVDISSQPTGIYIMQVVVNKEISDYKIIKE